MYNIFTRSKNLHENEKYAIDHSSRFHVVLIFNYKVFLLCSVITLSVYLLPIKIDGNMLKSITFLPRKPLFVRQCVEYFVMLFIFEMQLILDIFFQTQSFIIAIEIWGDSASLLTRQPYTF